ncbi:sensor histidine kinase [Roseateles aquatilis]|nr:sensor histidine kinase [Roseateles aquatilis]
MPALASAQSSTPSEQPLAHLQHTTWTLKDGMPGPVMAIAQTTDGYLWLGTGMGLYRFDGLRFERFETLAGERLPSRQVLALHATRDNGLWVGLLAGGAALVRQGRVLHVDPAGGPFEASTRAFAEERDGTLWTATGLALLKRVGNRWTAIGPESGYGDGLPTATMNVVVDRQDNVWAVTPRNVFVKAAGQDRFVDSGVPMLGMTQLAVGPDGRVWANDMSDQVRGVAPLPSPAATGTGAAPPGRLPVPKSYFMPFFDRAGALWYGALGGLARMRPGGAGAPGEAPQFMAASPGGQGLAGDQVMRIFQDREGTVWVGSNGGLDRFRGAAVDLVDLPERSSGIALSTDADGALWIAARDVLLKRPADGGPLQPVPFAAGMESLTAAFVDRQQRLWIGGRTGVWRQEGKTFVQMPTADGEPWAGAVLDIAEDARGVLWLTANRYGLNRYVDGRLQRMGGRDGFPRRPPNCIASDAEGRLWFGYGDGSLRRHDGQRLTTLTAADGLRVGDIKVIAPKGPRLWIGGESGVQLVSAPGMPEIRLADPTALEGVSGIVETDAGDLWLNGARGITRITAAELRRALADPAYRPKARRIDLRDGLRGQAEQSWPLRTAVQTRDGLLWFSLNNGLVRIDPAKVPPGDAPAPPVDIQRVTSGGDGHPVPADRRLRLAPGTRDLEIDYTATTLAVPERVRFRYQLVGQDHDWQEAGTRRRAFYTNLGPGSFEFRVEASQDDGPWSDTPATMTVEIAPTLAQTWWVRTIGVLAVLAELSTLAWLRARQVATHARDRLTARVQERERIARDLHDTLLQGMYGLILRFEAVARRLPGVERAAMERVLVDADALLIEGRDRVADLRLPPPDTGRLEQTLDALGQQLMQSHPARFALTVDGAPRPLDPTLSASLCLIAREAIFNAFQHARAQRIDVSIQYAADAFSLIVQDDGIGVPDDVQARGGRPGHWGLSGMRERAELAGAVYRLTSRPDRGTEVALRVPAARAYGPRGEDRARALGGRWRRFWRRF